MHILQNSALFLQSWFNANKWLICSADPIYYEKIALHNIWHSWLRKVALFTISHDPFQIESVIFNTWITQFPMYPQNHPLSSVFRDHKKSYNELLWGPQKIIPYFKTLFDYNTWFFWTAALIDFVKKYGWMFSLLQENIHFFRLFFLVRELGLSIGFMNRKKIVILYPNYYRWKLMSYYG